MTLKKSDLCSSLWKSRHRLCSGIDASQHKDNTLIPPFVKYASDRAKADSNSFIDFPGSGSPDDVPAAKGHNEIGDRINKVIAELAEAN